MAITQAPFGAYLTPTACTTRDRQRFNAALDSFIALIPDPTVTTGAVASTYAPDFDQISPQLAAKLRAEITAMRLAFNCTAVLTGTGDL